MFSYSIRSSIVRLLFVGPLYFGSAQFVSAQLPAPYFFDDFEDGSAVDGTPVDWQVVPWSEGTIQIDQGDLLLIPSSNLPNVPGYDPELTELDVRAGHIVLANGSFRTRFRVENPGTYVAIGMTARDNQVGEEDGPDGIFGTNLWVGLSNKGWNGFGGIDSNGEIQSTDVIQIGSGPGIGVGTTDINLQFDLFGDIGSATIWEEGEDKPEPRWTGDISDRFSPDGNLVVFFQVSRPDVTDVAARFRYVAVLPTATSPTMPGDFDEDFRLTIRDLDALNIAVRGHSADLVFDSNYDGVIDSGDPTAWVHHLRHTWIGDANLDGVFASHDLVQVFTAGQYDDNVVGNSTWETGDWDLNGDFDSGDLVIAFQDGGYEQGIRPSTFAVPEPLSYVRIVGLCIGLLDVRRQKIQGIRRQSSV